MAFRNKTRNAVKIHMHAVFLKIFSVCACMFDIVDAPRPTLHVLDKVRATDECCSFHQYVSSGLYVRVYSIFVGRRTRVHECTVLFFFFGTHAYAIGIDHIHNSTTCCMHVLQSVALCSVFGAQQSKRLHEKTHIFTIACRRSTYRTNGMTQLWSRRMNGMYFWTCRWFHMADVPVKAFKYNIFVAAVKWFMHVDTFNRSTHEQVRFVHASQLLGWMEYTRHTV